MLYNQYQVTDCGIHEDGDRQDYFCNLVNDVGHIVKFSLRIKGCVGEAGYMAQYEAIAPHIKIGELISCELAWRSDGDRLSLCISGILKCQAYNVDGSKISVEDYFNPNRGYWALHRTVGDWIRFPGLINCYGETTIHLNRDLYYDMMDSSSFKATKGRLVWVPVLPLGKVKQLIGKVRSWFSPVETQPKQA